ncbi:MAG: NUDIX hydrolase [Pyrinomonadaceae bacterium]
MLKDLLAGIWRRFPRALRRLTVRATHHRFSVTAAAIVIDNEGRVLLLKHRFRPGIGWGVPGGFLEADEQPEDGLRRELREEVGLELDDVSLVAARTIKKAKQIEIIFRGRPKGGASPQSIEISKVGWFYLQKLPEGLPEGQRLLIEEALQDGAKRTD